MRDWRDEIRSAIAVLKLEATREAEVVEELNQHLQDRREAMLASDLTVQQADEALLQELHDPALISGLKTTVHSELPPPVGSSSGGQIGRIWMDLRYAARVSIQNPAFSLVVILSLALGIGANTAIFQLLNAVRLRVLPVSRPDSLAAVRIVDSPHCCTGDFYSDHPDLTSDLWNQVRQQQQGFSEIAALYSTRLNAGHGIESRPVNTLMVSGNFFDVLGVQPSLGRMISPADDYRGCGAQDAVVSYGFWQREFGGDRGILERKISLEGHPFQIMGVTPSNFAGIEVGRSFDVAIPLCAEATISAKGPSRDPVAWWITTIGRLRPSWTIERASAQLAAISPAIFAATVPAQFDGPARKDYLSFRLGAVAAANGFSTLRRNYQEPLWLLLGLAGLVLLIACANLANLMLARASAREREMAVRSTLGASRPRLIRQLVTESLLLALLGAAAGVALAQMLSRVLITYLSTQRDRVFLELTLDWHVVGFVTGLAVLATVLFGLAPALRASRVAPGVVLKASGRGISASGESVLLRRALVVSQVALATVLLVSALLFARTFQNLMRVDTGFQQDHILIANFDYSPLKLPDASQTAFKRELLTHIQALPGVTSAAETLFPPLSQAGWDGNVDIPDGPQRQDVRLSRVSPGYFKTMQMELISGRDFNEADKPAALTKAIVNREFALKFFGKTNALGRTFYDSGKRDMPYQVIGVVNDTKYYSLREDPLPMVFVSFTQANGPQERSTLMIRSNESLPALISSIKSTAGQINPGMVMDFSVLKTQILDGLLRERLVATLSGFFGVLATVLAMVGLYGVISYLVVRRRSEIGLRMALGANRVDILAMVLREAATLLGTGLAIGTTLALSAGKIAASMLYGLKPWDPLTGAVAVTAMAVIALVASLLPAKRAASIDPMAALREE
ncbi:MAG TPA: ABC transporter permease [Bryobacteraceae bacterium]|nr:ABC transporter permease [Bryobacteraceae bacterium]